MYVDFRSPTTPMSHQTGIHLMFTPVSNKWVAKGKLNTSIIGVSPGIPLKNASSGPLFHNFKTVGTVKTLFVS